MMTYAEIFEATLKRVEKKGYSVSLPAPIEKIIEYKIYYKFIFDHDFAKALYGDVFVSRSSGFAVEFTVHGKNRLNIDMNQVEPAYLYHLARQAQTPEPLRYIERYLILII